MSRRKPVTIAAVIVVLIGSLGTVMGVRWWNGRCDAMVGAVPTTQKLPSNIRAVKPADVNLEPLVQSQRVFARNVLAQAQRTPSLGTLRSVAVAADEKTLAPREARQVVGVADGEPLLLFKQIELEGKQRVSAGALTRLDSNTGGKSWARWYNNHELEAAQTPQGLALTQLPSGKVPQVASVDPRSGELQWCVSVGGEHATAVLASGDSGLFALSDSDYYEDDQPPTLIALNPLTGKTRWKKQIDGFDDRGTVDAFGDKVLVTQWGDKTADRPWHPMLDRNGHVKTDGGALRAFRADDGEPAWEYGGPGGSGWLLSVVGARDSSAVVVATRTRPDAAGKGGERYVFSGRDSQNWLIGLGPDGRERWRQDLANRINAGARSGVSLAGDAVLTFEYKDTSVDTQTVVAREMSTGKTRWVKDFDHYQRSVRPARLAVVDGSLLIARAHDLISINLTSGAVQTLLIDAGVAADLDVKVDGRAIVAQAAGLILTFDRRPR
ncbi:PQQ-binding-like beta-propeller repeat protein [Kribbella sp. NPDC056345]|uniref:outer membrane protein assembly factor BamB family protein n=1 Tax=Kribbella sp. NPDC056345 TaxID=3345789 RepID=UPI0035DA69D0